MNLNMTAMKDALKASYDKIVLFLILVCLLVSVVSLGYRAIREKRVLDDSSWQTPSSKPRQAEQMQLVFVDDAIDELASPFHSGEHTNRMMVSELRVSCKKCGKPIPLIAKVCPFPTCKAVQVEKKKDDTGTTDADADGMLDTWEKEHGMNPRDPDDAFQDKDGDGFTNLEEFRSGTNPENDKEYPPPAAKLEVLAIKPVPVYLMFMSVTGSGDRRTFVLKDKRTLRDYYRKMGESIFDYKIVDYEEKSRVVTTRDMPMGRKVDVSTLRLERDGKPLVLTIRSSKAKGELAAKLLFKIDGKEYTVRLDSQLKLLDKVYKVFDMTEDTVIIVDESTGEKIELKTSAPIAPASSTDSDDSGDEAAGDALF